MDIKKKEGGDKQGVKAGTARGAENVVASVKSEPLADLPPTPLDDPVLAEAAVDPVQAAEVVASGDSSEVVVSELGSSAALEANVVQNPPVSDDRPWSGADSPAVLLEQAFSLMEKIRAEAEELTQEQRDHLHSHLKINPLHILNEHCFTDVQTFRQMTITFNNLRANSKAFLSILPDQSAIWSEGEAGSRMVGLSFSAITQPTMYLRNFLINAREMYLESYQDCSQIELKLYVRTEQTQLKGKVDLPPGASVTLESRCDRTSIIGLSSFGIDLE